MKNRYRREGNCLKSGGRGGGGGGARTVWQFNWLTARSHNCGFTVKCTILINIASKNFKCLKWHLISLIN